MPTVLRKYGYRFHFFSADGDEPPHIHVDGHGGTVKIWLDDLRPVKMAGFGERDLKRILAVVVDIGRNFWRHGMSTSVEGYPESDRPVEAWCDLHELHVRLADGRHVATPLWWYPRLLNATPAQRNTVELMIAGVHWPEIDEDLSIDGMLRGREARGAVEPKKVA